jgi:RNA polymerase sigma-70 factor (ECF subfamily)
MDEGVARQGQSVSEESQRRRFFEAEVERLTDRLYGTALRMTRNAADAEDLVAEALARAWTNLDSLHDLRCLEKWLFRILVNTLISDRRRRSARSVEEGTCDQDHAGEFSLFERLHQPFLLWWGNPEQQLLDKLLREDIERALDSLPEAFRIVVVMVEVQGFTYAEAAEALNVPVGTVRSRLSRGRATLQSALWHHASQMGIAVGGSGGVVS